MVYWDKSVHDFVGVSYFIGAYSISIAIIRAHKQDDELDYLNYWRFLYGST